MIPLTIKPADERPAYVTFETRPVEDRAASLTSGRFVGKDVDFAIVTPPGSKDRYEYIVLEWFDRLADQVRQKRYNPQWLDAYQAAYKAYKAGREAPLQGTPLRDWPALSPSSYRTCVDLGILTVEDLAAINEEGLRRLGMGGRALKDRAIAWLQAAQGPGALAAQLQAMQAQLDALQERNTSLEAQLARAQAGAAADLDAPEGGELADLLADGPDA